MLTSFPSMKHIGENVVRIEAEALRRLADRIAGPMAAAFDNAVELIFACAGRVVVTGMGKSGIIARKIAATLSSTGTPALFMHPVDAVHGDLGMVVRGDVVLALSASGETEEILRLLATLKRLQVPLISMTGDAVFDEKAAGESPATTQPQPHRRYPRLRRRLMLLWIVPSPRKLARSGWRRLLRPPPCWLWAMRWPWLSPKSAASRKKTLPTCIPAESWASDWPGSNR